MAKLFGAQRLVLEAIQQAPKDAAGFVTDAQVAQGTRIALKDVRDWIETLEGEDFVEVARTTAGVIASITAKGRLQLGLDQPIPPLQAGPEGVGAAEPVQTPSTDSPLATAAEAVSPPITPSPSPHAASPSTFSEPGTAPRTGAVDGFQVVLLIHGIRTQAEWGPMVRSKLEVPGQIEVIPIKYGYFDALRFWFPFWTRNKPIERVYKQIRVALQKYRRSHPDANLSIIAHSFGTYIAGEILKRGFDLHIHRLILCGSVLPQDFPWEQCQGRFDDDKIVNECGKSDIWPVLAQSASWGYGASGTHGFGAVLVKDRFHAGGHGQYFDPGFVEKYWEPFIRRGQYEGTGFETKMPPTPWWMSVLGILPLRWVFFAPIAILIGVSISMVANNHVSNGPQDYRVPRVPKQKSDLPAKGPSDQNRRTPPPPEPSPPSYRRDIFKNLSELQYKAVNMLEHGKVHEALALIDENLPAMDEALKAFPNDERSHTLMGYTLKDIYQSSKNLLSAEQRQAYLGQARKSFEHALELDPNSAGAHNGMGNVLFFEGHFDEAIKEHDKALELTNGQYPAAKHDKQLVIRVKNGEIPFDF